MYLNMSCPVNYNIIEIAEPERNHKFGKSKSVLGNSNIMRCYGAAQLPWPNSCSPDVTKSRINRECCTIHSDP